MPNLYSAIDYQIVDGDWGAWHTDSIRCPSGQEQRRTEAKVHAGRRRDAGLERDGELDAKLSGNCSVVGSAPISEVDNAHDSQRA